MGARFIQEYQVGYGEVGRRFPPLLAGRLVAFAGGERLFFGSSRAVGWPGAWPTG